MAATATETVAEANGAPEPLSVGSLEYAIRYEETIAAEAKLIWEGDEDERRTQLDAHLLRQLRPLLRRPIPQAFIEHVDAVKGKPYKSTGIKSVQVQMDRLDNVLGPENWGYEAKHTDDGRRCHVKAWVGKVPIEIPLVQRDSWGGVNQGSTEGNLWKGSFTNAAKVALARLGPGWEIYVGAADFDPDTDEAAAEAQQAEGTAPPLDRIDSERVADLVSAYEAIKATGVDKEKLVRDVKVMLGSMGVPTPSVNRAFASLTPAQADELSAWLAKWEES